MPDVDTDTASALAIQYQDASIALRAINRRRDRGELTGRNGAATQRTIEYHEGRMLRVERTLTGRDENSRRLAGLLHAQHELADRVRQNRAAQVDRPELSARTRTIRKQIGDLLTVLTDEQ